jgi:hypothetical protein
MSQVDLNALEREVELTRAKFAHDLAGCARRTIFRNQRGSLGARPRDQGRAAGGFKGACRRQSPGAGGRCHWRGVAPVSQAIQMLKFAK